MIDTCHLRIILRVNLLTYLLNYLLANSERQLSRDESGTLLRAQLIRPYYDTTE